MKINRWSSFPRWWVRQGLKKFVGGPAAGENMAALRVYLAIALSANFRSRTGSPSWSDLEDLTGLSRPMVSKGIAAAQKAGIVSVDATGYRHSYVLCSPKHFDADTIVPFAQVPTTRLRTALPKLPKRGAHALDSLKLYIALATVRPRDSWQVSISHTSIVEWTGIQPRNVRMATDVLINHRLIHVTMAESSDVGHPHNAYQLLGFQRTADGSGEPAPSNESDKSPFAPAQEL